MSTPALRQPKLMNPVRKPISSAIYSDNQNVILTLKNARKLVISSDSYNGIIMAGNMYKCVFCGTEMELDREWKKAHVSSQKHIKRMECYPHLEEFSENLLRKMSCSDLYCTICNVMVLSPFMARHISSDSHKELLEKAKMKANSYKPYMIS